jgi:hypothetical protein
VRLRRRTRRSCASPQTQPHCFHPAIDLCGSGRSSLCRVPSTNYPFRSLFLRYTHTDATVLSRDDVCNGALVLTPDAQRTLDTIMPWLENHESFVLVGPEGELLHRLVHPPPTTTTTTDDHAPPSVHCLQLQHSSHTTHCHHNHSRPLTTHHHQCTASSSSTHYTPHTATTTGCGKQTILRHAFSRVNAAVAMVHCNAQTSPSDVQDKIAQCCAVFNSNAGRVYRPKTGDSLILCVSNTSNPSHTLLHCLSIPRTYSLPISCTLFQSHALSSNLMHSLPISCTLFQSHALSSNLMHSLPTPCIHSLAMSCTHIKRFDSLPPKPPLCCPFTHIDSRPLFI